MVLQRVKMSDLLMDPKLVMELDLKLGILLVVLTVNRTVLWKESSMENWMVFL